MKVYIGIDWSTQKHDIVYLNEEGGLILYQNIPHSPAGFEVFDEQRQNLGVGVEDCLVGLETEHNLIMDFLRSRGYGPIYVIPPSMIRDLRGRFGASKSKTDRSDAHLIADVVRTDQARLHACLADSSLTRQITALVSLERFLTRAIVQTTNRLREALWRYYPNATKVFSHLDLPISLEFICSFPTPQAAAALTIEGFRAFAKAHHYTHPSKLAACYARLQQPQPEAQESTILAHQSAAVRLARLELHQIQDKTATLAELQELFIQHPDYPVFSSLPGAGKILAPALLATCACGTVQASSGMTANVFPTPRSCNRSPVLVRLLRLAANTKPLPSEEPVIMIFEPSSNSGRNALWTTPCGLTLIFKPFVPTALRSAMRIDD